MVGCVAALENVLDGFLTKIQAKIGGKDSWIGESINDFLSFETPKVARIREGKLGLLYYIAFGMIIAYFVFSLGSSLDFLEVSTPSMSINLEIDAPAVGSCESGYGEGPECHQAFTSIRNLPYCCQDIARARSPEQACAFHAGDTMSCSCPSLPDVRSHPCDHIDVLDIAKIKASTVYLMTYRSTSHEVVNPACYKSGGLSSLECQHLWKTNDNHTKNKIFVADFERFTVSLDHSVNLESFGISSSLIEMEGFLQVGRRSEGISDLQRKLCREREDARTAPYNGKPTSSAPCFIRPKRTLAGDQFEMGVLLQAMGVDLDARGIKPGLSLRDQGFKVDVDVVYFNSSPWQGLLDKVYYYYKMKPYTGVGHREFEWKLIGADSLEGRERSVQISNGIYMNFSVAGRLGMFSMSKLLMTGTVALGMMAVVTVFLNLVARFLLRHGAYYTLLIYDTSGDFGHLDQLHNKLDTDILNKLLRARDLRTSGTRDERLLRLVQSGYRMDVETPVPMTEVAAASSSSHGAAGALVGSAGARNSRSSAD